MNPKYHIFACMNRRPEGHPRGSCQSSGAGTVFDAFAAEIERNNLAETVYLTGTFCMGPCDKGPVVVVYPEGVWYGKVTARDVPEIIEQHMVGGKPLERLRLG